MNRQLYFGSLPFSFSFVMAIFLFAGLAVNALAATGFPQELIFKEEGQARRMVFTGEAERVFLLFRVYDIAHYAESQEYQALSTDNVVTDGPAKAIVIKFARKLKRDQIRDEFDKSLRRNAQPGWLASAEPAIRAFVDAIDRDARPGDELAFYWLAGGQLFAEFNGEREFAVTDTAFAKLIWSIWFGEDPACDRDELLARAAAAGGA